MLAVNDSFIYRAPIPTDSVINISIDADNSVFFWYETGTVTITGSIDAFNTLHITGTSENDVLELFRQQVERVYPKHIVTAGGKLVDNPQKTQATVEFITKHSDHQTSLYLLFMLAVFNPTEARKYYILYQDLGPKVRTSKVGKQLGELLSES